MSKAKPGAFEIEALGKQPKVNAQMSHWPQNNFKAKGVDEDVFTDSSLSMTSTRTKQAAPLLT